MANVALEVAAAAFGKIEQDQRNLLQKGGNRPKWLFFYSAERVVPHDTVFFEVSRCQK